MPSHLPNNLSAKELWKQKTVNKQNLKSKSEADLLEFAAGGESVFGLELHIEHLPSGHQAPDSSFGNMEPMQRLYKHPEEMKSLGQTRIKLA